MYPYVLMLQEDTFFTENQNHFTFTIKKINKEELSLLFQPNYALLLTYGDIQIDIIERMKPRHIHYKEHYQPLKILHLGYLLD